MLKLNTLSADAEDDVISYNVIQDLKSQDLAEQMESIRLVRSLLCAEELPVSRMMEADTIAPLVDVLGRDDCVDLQNRALGVLTIVGFGARQHTDYVVNSRVISKLVTLLHTEGDLVEHAILVLGNIALHGPAARHAVLARGAVRAMLPRMRTDAPVRRLRTFVRAYSNLCSYEDDDHKTHLELVSPGLLCILDILDIENEESLDLDDKEVPFIACDIIVDACTALTNIMHGPDECIEAVQLVPGLTARLVGLLGHKEAIVKEAALAAVGNMLAGTDAQVDRCLDANCLGHIVSLLQSSHPSIVKEAARATGNILAGTHAQIQQALNEDILTQLQTILAYGDSECQKQAAVAVTNLCYNGSALQRAGLVLSGALQPYCALLAAEDRAVAGEVLDGLDVLTQAAERDGNVKPLCYMLDEEDVLDHMQLLLERVIDEDHRCKIVNMSATLRKHAREERFVVHDEIEYTIKKIVQDLESHDLATQTRASHAAYCILTEQNPPINALLEAGIMAPLVKGLDRDASNDLINLATRAFSIITAGTRKHRTAVVESGAIPKLLSLLDRGDEIAELASCSLGDLALHGPETRDAVLAYVRSGTTLTELTTFMRTYGNLCSQVRHESMEELEPVLRALPFVFELLNIGDQEILKEACLACDKLIPGPDNQSIEAIQAVPGLAARLVALLAHEDADVQEAALMAVGNMLAGNETQADRCLDAGCLDNIKSLLQCSDPALVELAAMAASNILGGTPTQIQRALEKDILTPLLDILADGEPNCQIQAIFAISNICISDSALQRAGLVLSGALLPYCALLAAEDLGVAGEVLDGLEQLIQNAEQNDELKLLCEKLDKIGVIEQLTQFQEQEIDEDFRLKAIEASATLRRQARGECVIVEDGELFTPAEIVRGLESPDPTRQAVAARAARSVLSGEDAPRTAMLRAGLVAPLVAALDRGDLVAAGALLNITAGTHQHRVAVVNSGAIAKLVALLAHGTDIAILAAQIIGNITLRAPTTRDMVLAHGAVRAMLPHLRRDAPPELLMSCVVAYRNLCTDIVSSSMVELVSPALPYISELLDIEDLDVVVPACGALVNLMIGLDERKDVVQAVPGLTARLVGLLGHEATRVRVAALDAVSNMLSGTEIHAEYCLDAGCLERIVFLLQCSEAPLIEPAVRAVCNIFGQMHSHIQRVLEKDILSSLVNILADSEPNSFLEYGIVSALNNITSRGTREHRMAVVDIGAIPHLVVLLTHEEAVAEQAANALGNIAEEGLEATDIVLAHGAVRAMLPHLRLDALPELLRTCVWAYGVWCRTIVSTLTFELLSPALPYISELLDIKNQEILEITCTAIGNLILGMEERKEAVQLVPGLTARLVALLGHEATEGNVRNAALNAVANMLAGNETQINRCLDAGCLEYLVPLLQSHEPTLREEAARATCNMLRPTHTQIQRALKKGILKPLLVILADTDSNSSRQYQAVGALFNIITYGTPEHITAVINSGAILILAGMVSNEIEVAKLAVDVLGYLAGKSQETRDIVLAHGAVRSMLPHMRRDAPLELLTSCVKAYRSYCRHDDDIRAVKLELVSPALPHMSELLAVEDEDVLEHVCWALIHLTKTREGVDLVQLVPGLTARLAGLLGHAPAKVKNLAIIAVTLMLSGTDIQVNRCLAANCAEHLISYLECRNSALIEKAVKATRDTLGAEHPWIQRALDEDSLTPLMTILACHPKGQIRTMKAISNMYCRATGKQRARLVSCGALQPCGALLAAEDLAVVRTALAALDDLLKVARNDDNLKQFCQQLVEIGVLDQLKLLRDHEDEEVSETSRRLLRTYFQRESQQLTMEFSYFLKLCFQLTYEVWNQL